MQKRFRCVHFATMIAMAHVCVILTFSLIACESASLPGERLEYDRFSKSDYDQQASLRCLVVRVETIILMPDNAPVIISHISNTGEQEIRCHPGTIDHAVAGMLFKADKSWHKLFEFPSFQTINLGPLKMESILLEPGQTRKHGTYLGSALHLATWIERETLPGNLHVKVESVNFRAGTVCEGESDTELICFP